MLPQLPSRCLSSTQSVHNDAEICGNATEVTPPASPRPVFQLTVGDWVLFAELVQSTLQSSGREMVWARPLLLVFRQAGEHTAMDLEGVPDLLWPATHFSPAYAEDMLPYMADSVSLPSDAAQQQLRTFIQRVWETYECCQAAS